MKREALIAAALAALGLPVRATISVIDGSQIAQDAAHEVVNIAKWIDTDLKTGQTAVNTFNSYQNTVTQLIRMGDPSQIRNLPGISEVGQLLATGQQLQQSYAQLPNYFNPSNYQRDLNNVLSSFQRPTWNGWTTANGAYVPSTPSLYQFDTARWNSANQVQTWLAQIQNDRQTLQARQNQLQQQLIAASTDAETKKLHAQLDNVHAALAQLDARSQQVVEQGKIQDQKIAAGQAVNDAAQREQAAALRLQQTDRAFGSFPSAGVHQTVTWNP